MNDGTPASPKKSPNFFWRFTKIIYTFALSKIYNNAPIPNTY